jgi:hypothetical protein
VTGTQWATVKGRAIVGATAEENLRAVNRRF